LGKSDEFFLDLLIAKNQIVIDPDRVLD